MLILTCAYSTNHAAEHGPGHGTWGLEPRVHLQRNLTAAIGASYARTCDRHLLSGQGRHALLMAIPCVNTLRLAFVATPAQPGYLILQEAEGD